MPSQLPAFGLTVAARMEGYRERLAVNITRERKRRGESPMDLAFAIGVDKRTVERWEAGEREPQTKKLKALADHWSVDVGDLRPDLEAEERALRDQLDRIEAKLDALLRVLDVDPAAITVPHHGSDPRDELEEELRVAGEEHAPRGADSGSSGRARRRAARAR